jgi:hypothetical protein
MDDFKKPYEYEEEKKGFILAFVIMLIAFDMPISLFHIVQAYNIINRVSAFGTVFLIICILFLIFLLLTSVFCYRLWKNMVTIAKTYLIVDAVFTTFCTFTIFIYNLGIKGQIGKNGQYTSVFAMTAVLLIMPLVILFGFCGGWYLYFTRSKKIKEFVNKSSKNDQNN